MGYKRAEWHSGFTYRQTCAQCKTIVMYMDDKLDFRPWYPDGFVYCPKCDTPLRHNERYAIDAPSSVSAVNVNAVFCTGCGKQLSVGDIFCSACGKKVEVENKKICSKCGYDTHEAGALFCTKCGNKL